MEPSTLIYALNGFKLTYRITILVIDTIFVNNYTFSIRGWLLGNHVDVLATWIYMVARYIW